MHKIKEILDAHRKWLQAEDGGERASLSYANLSSASLSGADLSGADLGSVNLCSAKLSGADLSGANLSSANLSSANLSDADLYGANLSNANLSSANLSNATGICRLPVGDPRGYDCIAVWHGDHWMIAAGCRWFCAEEARKHWGADYDGDRDIGDRYLAGLDWLEKQPTPQKEAAE